ncbi:hypothetical protein BDW68DRAFT_161259 [Aspergillus falconensis]
MYIQKSALLTLAGLAALLPLASAQSFEVGGACDGWDGRYVCADDRRNILICDRGTFRLAAECSPQCCVVQTVIGVPYCNC